jgi:hypothetical protein
MSDIFVQRSFDPPLTDESFDEMARNGLSCLNLYRVKWRQSFLSADGCRLVCWFSAPDAESTRLALRKAGSHDAIPWSGTIHDSPAQDAPAPETTNVVVERSWESPMKIEQIQAIEDAGIACLEVRNVHFSRSFFSRDRKRMVCLYRAPDAESVREAQREARMPVDSVWSFRLKS